MLSLRVPSSGESNFRPSPEMTTSRFSGSGSTELSPSRDMFFSTRSVHQFLIFSTHRHTSSNCSAHRITHAHSVEFPREFPSGYVCLLQVYGGGSSFLHSSGRLGSRLADFGEANGGDALVGRGVQLLFSFSGCVDGFVPRVGRPNYRLWNYGA